MALQYQLRNGDWVELTQGAERVTYPTGGGANEDCPCMVFLKCDRLAVTTIPHPILGDVPACRRCADRSSR
jgi:hypothetical protein